MFPSLIFNKFEAELKCCSSRRRKKEQDFLRRNIAKIDPSVSNISIASALSNAVLLSCFEFLVTWAKRGTPKEQGYTQGTGIFPGEKRNNKE